MSAEQGATKLLNTAEELVDTLDNLSVCLKHIEEKYMQEGKTESGKSIDKSSSLYAKLKESLEAAQSLTDSIKREKWRLSRREMSIELRMGELQEYKSHMKKDMCDMNQTVEALSMRVIQLENALCEAQDSEERLVAERASLNKLSKESERQITHLEEKLAASQDEMKKLRQQRTDTVLKMQNEDISNKMEVLYLENQRLKEMIREREDDANKQSESEADIDKATSETKSTVNMNAKALERSASPGVSPNSPTPIRQSSVGSPTHASGRAINGHEQNCAISEIAYV